MKSILKKRIKMKIDFKKMAYQLFYYSNIIVNYVFWGYFLLMIIYHFILNKNIPIVLSFLFFLLLGVYWGYNLARKAYDYLRENQESK